MKVDVVAFDRHRIAPLDFSRSAHSGKVASRAACFHVLRLEVRATKQNERSAATRVFSAQGDTKLKGAPIWCGRRSFDIVCAKKWGIRT